MHFHPRIRTIKPEFFLHEELAELSAFARLVFIGLWTVADRNGCLPDRPRRLKVTILPYDDDVSFDEILDQLAEHHFIERYSADNGELFIKITGFSDHQVIRKDEPIYQNAEKRGRATEKRGRAADKRGRALGKESKGKDQERSTDRVREVVTLWNNTVTEPIPKVTKATDGRTRAVLARLKEYPDLSDWERVFCYINGQPWCRGQGDRKWVADFNWLLKPEPFTKYLEQSKTEPPKRSGRAATADTKQYDQAVNFGGAS